MQGRIRTGAGAERWALDNRRGGDIDCMVIVVDLVFTGLFYVIDSTLSTAPERKMDE